MNLGTLTFDEILCDITHITLENGELAIYATSRTPATLTVDTYSDITIFDPDANLVAHIPSIAHGKHPNHTHNGQIHIRIPINISNITNRQYKNDRIPL